MCQEPTGLLWIGCLTGLIWIPRFKFGTSTPNINSQSYWPKVISHVMSGTFFLICSPSSHFSSTCCDQEFQLDQLLQNDGEEDAGTKRRRQNCGKIKDHGDEPDIKLSRQAPHPWPTRLRRKSPGILTASTGKTDATTRRNSKPDAASSSQGRLKDAYLGGLMAEVAGETCGDR